MWKCTRTIILFDIVYYLPCPLFSTVCALITYTYILILYFCNTISKMTSIINDLQDTFFVIGTYVLHKHSNILCTYKLCVCVCVYDCITLRTEQLYAPLITMYATKKKFVDIMAENKRHCSCNRSIVQVNNSCYYFLWRTKLFT